MSALIHLAPYALGIVAVAFAASELASFARIMRHDWRKLASEARRDHTREIRFTIREL